MPKLTRAYSRLLRMALLVPVVLLVLGLLYQAGMTYLEGSPRTLGDGLAWAAETLTTVGYGRDTHWSHPVMKGFVIISEFVGVTLIFLVFPVFIIPFLEERFEARLPTQLPDLAGQVLIYRYSPAITTLLDDLAEAGVPAVIFEEDEGVARRLHERGIQVVLGNLEEEDPKLGALVGARGLVVNGGDDDNAAMALSARYHGYTGPIVALVSNPQRRPPMIRAGANTAFTPDHILAGALAARASIRISRLAAGVRHLGNRLEVAEHRVHAGSPYAGKTLAASGIRKETGATIVGLWVGGEFRRHPVASTVLEVGMILVAIGHQRGLERLGELATPVPHSGGFVVVGGTDVGDKVAEFLRDASEQVRVLKVAGPSDPTDPLDPGVLESAGVRTAQAVIVARETDSATLFAVAVVRNTAPDAVIIAAANRVENVSRIHRAGADFALSLSQVAGQLLTFHLLGEESVSLEAEIKLVAAGAGALAGRPLMEHRILERTGCAVVAVERGSEIIVEFDQSFAVESEDIVYLSGTSETFTEFYRLFPDSRTRQHRVVVAADAAPGPADLERGL